MLDAHMRLVALSDVFRFTGAEVEFCAGLALASCEKSLLVSFGARDTEALVARIELERVLGVLRAID
jgi:hypothetical protein